MNEGEITVSGETFTGQLVSPRLVYGTPVDFRWARKPSGETVLQAAYRWEQWAGGRPSEAGIEWRELETVDIAGETA